MENEKRKLHLTKPWRRVIALVCVVALMISLVAFLADTSISADDGIGAETLAQNDEFASGNTLERAGYALNSLLSGNKDLKSNYEQASVYIGKAKYEDALNCISRCLELTDADTDQTLLDDLWLKYSCLQAVLGHYDEALDGFTHMSDDSEYNAERELIRAQIALEESDMETAYTHMTEYVTLQPDDDSVSAMYADTCYYTQHYQDASLWYGRAQRTDGTLEPAEYMFWGLCMMETDHPDLAVEKLQQSVDAGYEDPGMCYSQSAICCYLQGKYEDALSYGDKALTAASENVDYGVLYFYLGLSAFSLEKYKEAAASLRTAEEKGFQAEELWFYRAFSEMMLDDLTTAVEDFGTCIDYGGSLTDSAYLYRGICAVQMEDWEGAKADLTVAAASSKEEISSAAQDILSELQTG